MGQPVEMTRTGGKQTVLLGTSLGAGPEIDISGFALGSILLPLGSPVTSVTFYGAPGVGGTYALIVPTPLASNPMSVGSGGMSGFRIPDEFMGYGALQIVADHGGPVSLSFKS